MNKKLVINRSLIADGLLFITPGDRCRYLGKWSWEKPRWLSENAGKYRRLDDGEQQSAELYSSIENDKNGAPPTRSNCEASSPDVRKGDDNNDNDFSSIVTPPQDRSHSSRPASLPLPWNEKVPSGSTQTELLPRAKAAACETTGPKPETAPLRQGRKQARSRSRQVKKQKTSAGISKSARKFSPELMQVVLDSLRECPILSAQPTKQAYTAKHLSIGSGEVRLAMMVTTSSWKDLHGDFMKAANQRSTRPTIMSSRLRGKLHSEAPSTRTTRFSLTFVSKALTRTRRMKTETLL